MATVKKKLDNSSFITWGKYKGVPVTKVAEEDPEYIILLNGSKFFEVSADVVLKAKQQMNLAK